MDGATIQARIYTGYAKAAARLGVAHQQYRPASLAVNPLDAVNLVGSVNASMTINGQYNGQTKPDQLLWQVIVDGNVVQAGDYLVGTNTWCVLNKQALMPILALRCTDTVTISRSVQTFTTAGGLTSGEQVIALSVPCYIQLKRDKGFSEPGAFPAQTNSSAPMPEWMIYLGLGGTMPAGTFRSGDIVTTSSGEVWKVDAVNTSPVLWTLACTPSRPYA